MKIKLITLLLITTSITIASPKDIKKLIPILSKNQAPKIIKHKKKPKSKKPKLVKHKQKSKKPAHDLSKQKQQPQSQKQNTPQPEAILETSKETQPVKEWNLIVYMAANNNLHSFSIRNLQQMLHVGSTDHINVLVQMDGYRQQEISRYYIKKGQTEPIDLLEYDQSTISGTSKSLYEFVKWSVTNYPAKHQALLLWNHGSGIKDPSIWGKTIILHRDELFSFHHGSCMLQLNRRNLDDDSELDFFRGIAFNDTFETYITNQEMSDTLYKIKTELLSNKNIDLLIMDACYMAMVEICSQVKDSVDIMVGSQEIEPGSGYNYIYVLEKFKEQTLSPAEFACHIVESYKKEYSYFNADFTQSAVNLKQLNKIEENISLIAIQLKQMLKAKDKKYAAFFIKSIRFSRRYTTEFCDPDYIDLGNFLEGLVNRVEDAKKKLDQNIYTEFLSDLEKVKILAEEGLNLLSSIVLQSVSGINLSKVHGLSIYFPKNSIHSSYLKTEFDKTTKWADFLHDFSRAMFSLPQRGIAAEDYFLRTMNACN